MQRRQRKEAVSYTHLPYRHYPCTSAFRLVRLSAGSCLCRAYSVSYTHLGLQEECAVESMADYIVTRNPADFKHSRVKVILPDELLRELEKN